MTEPLQGDRPARATGTAAVALRLAGASYPEVANTLGYATPTEAREAVEQVLGLMAKDADPAAREMLRATEAARLDRLLRAVWGKATDPADVEQLPASRVALSLIDRRIRLYGLDAPQQIAVYSPTTAEIDQWVTLMLGSSGQAALTEPDLIVIDADIIAEDPPDARTG